MKYYRPWFQKVKSLNLHSFVSSQQQKVTTEKKINEAKKEKYQRETEQEKYQRETENVPKKTWGN